MSPRRLLQTKALQAPYDLFGPGINLIWGQPTSPCLSSSYAPSFMRSTSGQGPELRLQGCPLAWLKDFGSVSLWDLWNTSPSNKRHLSHQMWLVNLPQYGHSRAPKPINTRETPKVYNHLHFYTLKTLSNLYLFGFYSHKFRLMHHNGYAKYPSASLWPCLVFADFPWLK